MSIGADWRQISPGNAPANATGTQPAGASPAGQATPAAEDGRSFSDYMFGEDGFDFSDVIDVINPLQHIPIVSMFYRSITGDELGNGARLVGGGLFGGIFGLAGAAVDAVVDLATGEDTGEHVMAMFTDDAPDDGPALASSDAPAGQNGTANGGAPSGGGDSDGARAVADAGGVTPTSGGLVLPWSLNDHSMAPETGRIAASAAEQATIAGNVPVGPVETLGLGADVNAPVSAAVLAANGGGGVFPARANTGNGAFATPQEAFDQGAGSQLAQNGRTPDPAELAVAIAQAGQGDIAGNMAHRFGPKKISGASGGAAYGNVNGGVQNASFRSARGETVLERARNSGRMFISAAHYTPPQSAASANGANSGKSVNFDKINYDALRARGTPLEEVASDGTNNTSNAGRETGTNGAFGNVASNRATPVNPLSASEMAARFDAALGRETAQNMALDARSAAVNPFGQRDFGASPSADRGTHGNNMAQNSDHNRVSNAGISNAARSDNAVRASATPQAQGQPATGTNTADLAAHPLMEQAQSHIGSEQPVGAWFSQTMIDGLRKYQAMQEHGETVEQGNSI